MWSGAQCHPTGRQRRMMRTGERGVGNGVSDDNVSQSKTMRLVIFSIVHAGNVPMWHLAGLRVESVGPAHCRALPMFNGSLSSVALPANTISHFAGPITAFCFFTQAASSKWPASQLALPVSQPHAQWLSARLLVRTDSGRAFTQQLCHPTCNS
jgi:hypothetical protein